MNKLINKSSYYVQVNNNKENNGSELLT